MGLNISYVVWKTLRWDYKGVLLTSVLCFITLEVR